MKNEVRKKFFQLLQLAVGSVENLTIDISVEEWNELYDMACRQSILGVLLIAMDKLSMKDVKPPLTVLYKWIGAVENIKQHNHLLDTRCKQLVSFFEREEYLSCIIKGQGVARLYPQPYLRQPGDIDIWVDAKREDVINIMQSKGILTYYVDYVNCHASFFEDMVVEVHFIPTYMYCPFINKKVQKWIIEKKSIQMNSFDSNVEFSYPTIEFNLVFSLIHIYRHVLFEGIGLRQFTDYYYILVHSSREERIRAFETLKSFSMAKFVGAVMYVMQYVFKLDESHMLCGACEKQGKKMLDEIIRGGNFGQFDDRIKRYDAKYRWKRGWENLKRDMYFISDYPSEILWMPLWKLWHWWWRKRKGYL